LTSSWLLERACGPALREPAHANSLCTDATSRRGPHFNVPNSTLDAKVDFTCFAELPRAARVGSQAQNFSSASKNSPQSSHARQEPR
jgi:hypothetical protein